MPLPAVWTAPDAPNLTERQQRVFALLCEREVGTFRPIAQLSEELGDRSTAAIYGTLEQLAARGMVERCEPPMGWRVRWLNKPPVYVKQGHREGWLICKPHEELQGQPPAFSHLSEAR